MYYRYAEVTYAYLAREVADAILRARRVAARCRSVRRTLAPGPFLHLRHDEHFLSDAILPAFVERDLYFYELGTNSVLTSGKL